MFLSEVYQNRRLQQDDTGAARKVAELNIQSVCSKESCSQEAAEKKVAQYVTSAIIGDPAPGENSYATVQRTGQNMLVVAGVLVAANGVLTIAMESLKGVGDSAIGLFGAGVPAMAVSATIGLVVSVLSFAVKWIGGAGIVLVLVLPLLSSLMWMAMVINWMIKTIVMMIAMPFVAVANVGPTEGSALGGGLVSRGMVQALGVVLMPPLMILGLAASLAVSAVGFDAMHSIMMSASGIYVTGIFSAIAMVVMYTVGNVLVHLTSLYLSAKIPEQTMDWLAMGTGGQDGSVVATETRQMHTSAMHQAQQASPNGDVSSSVRGAGGRPVGMA